MPRPTRKALILAAALFAALVTPAAAQAADTITLVAAGSLQEDVAFIVSSSYTISPSGSRNLTVTSRRGGGECSATSVMETTGGASTVISSVVSSNSTTSVNTTYSDAGVYRLCGYLTDGSATTAVYDYPNVNVRANVPTITISAERLTNSSVEFTVTGVSLSPRTLLWAVNNGSAACSAAPSESTGSIPVAGQFAIRETHSSIAYETSRTVCAWVREDSTGLIDGAGSFTYDLRTPQACVDAGRTQRLAEGDTVRLSRTNATWEALVKKTFAANQKTTKQYSVAKKSHRKVKGARARARSAKKLTALKRKAVKSKNTYLDAKYGALKAAAALTDSRDLVTALTKDTTTACKP